MELPKDLPLGKPTTYPSRYDPSVLHVLDRAAQRGELGIGGALPFLGEDVWNAYELTWLGDAGLPRVGVLTLNVPCASPTMVESKSLKLYLDSFALTAFGSVADVAATIERDVSRCVGAAVRASVRPIGERGGAAKFDGFLLDDLVVEVAAYRRNPTLLVGAEGEGRDAVHTHLFRTVCPATGQPDSGSIAIAWRGGRLEREGLLAYLVSYREEPCFHEHAVERIFSDVRAVAQASELTVHGRFLRRGGIDINPFRSTRYTRAPRMRLPRQ